MTTIRIGFGEKEKRVTVKEGDLLLILQKNRGSHKIGVLREIRNSKTIYFEDGHMALKEPFKLEGGRGIGGVTPLPDYRDVPLNRILELYKGPKEIAGYLREKGWDTHAEWIEKLSEDKPELPTPTNMFYLPQNLTRVE